VKIVVLIARVLLGFMFFVFGLNNILGNFLHMPMPSGDPGTFLMLLYSTRYMTFVALLQVIGGLLLLVGRYVPLALVILGPIIVNILCFHFLIAKGGAAPGLIATVFEIFLIWAYRLSFRGLFDAAPEVS
jgi:uncharacterized membrane protein YphA (DoxX/SURF4 family)